MIATYQPETDILSASKIDLDLEEILTDLTANDFAAAMTVYESGTNSDQTLQSISQPGATSMVSDTWWPIYKVYWADQINYADEFVQKYGGAGAPYQDATRVELVKKGIAYQGVWMYAVHKFETAIADCLKGTTADVNSAKLNWDKGMAYYVGSQEGTTTGASTGNLLYNLAQKRCADFGTCATGTDSSTLADANNRVMNEHAVLGRDLLIQQKCTDARLATSFNSIISQMTVPLVQARRPRRNFLLAPSVRSSTRQLHLLDSGPRFSSIINAHTGPAQVRVEGRPGERQLVQRRGWE